MRILAIDPGTTQSGFVLYDGKVLSSGVMPNEDLLRVVEDDRSDALAIEKIVSYGNVVNNDTFDTCEWIGRFQQAWACPGEVIKIKRLEVKKALGLMGSAKDKDVNGAILALVGPKGTKRAPGPTYGVSSHAWAALGVAYAASKQLGG
ncbi:hypothetical protein [Pseudoxanthomonas sp.]|uniref:hypothetical protein n=1 Tax=Pseudoxanthomonas sp. TaxID=1871049 RepID=UPI003F7E2CA2